MRNILLTFTGMNFTRISSYFFTRMYPYVSRMLVVCYSYVSVCSVCYSYVTRMLLVCYSYVTRMYSCGVLVMITDQWGRFLSNVHLPTAFPFLDGVRLRES